MRTMSSSHNTDIGISHEISYDAMIRNNTLIGNGYGDPRGWIWGAEIQIQNSKNVEVYGNRIDMTGGGNGIVLIQQNRGSGEFGPHVTTGNHIHDNIIVDHDGKGLIGGVADYNWSGMPMAETPGATINTTCLTWEIDSGGAAVTASPDLKVILPGLAAQSHKSIPTQTTG